MKRLSLSIFLAPLNRSTRSIRNPFHSQFQTSPRSNCRRRNHSFLSSARTMATSTEKVEISLPSLPAHHAQFIEYVAAHPETPMLDLVEPYKQYDTEVRKAFAQFSDHPAAKQPNIVPVFAGHEHEVKVRARDLNAESPKEKECYIMPLKDEDRKPNGSPAIVQSLRDFKTHFNVFSESSLVDLDWSNVVVAGSAVVTSLLAVPEKHAGSKRALRQYYHELIAPASDVDLFVCASSPKPDPADVRF